MQEALYIRQIAVLGAGVMGAQIAAHCANAGFKTLLFDLTAMQGGRSSIVERALHNLTKLSPTPLAHANAWQNIEACNYEDNLPKLRDCTLVIEAIAERMDWKVALYERIVPFLGDETILVSNTSGLSIHQLSLSLPQALRTRFCGVHFFNPPRYMHLTELIPAQDTSPDLLDALETWLTSMLGKGVIRAKDTPNFIANRIGVFSLLSTLHHAHAFGLAPDEVDALTGTLIGRPKSATYRTLDVVGLDTMLHVVNTMKDKLQEDPWHQYYALPKWMMELIEKGALGQKSKHGIYRKSADGIEVYHPASRGYQPSKAHVSDEVLAILRTSHLKERMQRLFSSHHPQALFLKACFLDLFHYCCYHLQGIAHTVRDIDLAMCWGFGWAMGPFATWQSADLALITHTLKDALNAPKLMTTAPLPGWVTHLEAFYLDGSAYSPEEKDYVKSSALPIYQRQHILPQSQFKLISKKQAIYENDAVTLWRVQDGFAAISFKTKANTVNIAWVDGMREALVKARDQFQGVVLYQEDAANFSLGANLGDVLDMARKKHYSAIEQWVADFQDVLMQMKYSPIPIVAALRGRALGGGCEMLLHTSSIVSAFESYPGLVELGVGLIPAGGGCKEMALRASLQQVGHDLWTYLSPYFNQIARAEVSMSAVDAKRRGYLRESDTWVMHTEEVLSAALAKLTELKAANYKPPIEKTFPVAGLPGIARFDAWIVNALRGDFISEYDYEIGKTLAYVMCGGAVDAETLVSEAWILKLEREGFMRLIEHEKTQARMASMLETGKPLRN